MLQEISVKSNNKHDTVDITKEVKNAVKDSKVKEGLCCVYSPHTTCSILINENYDPNVMVDILALLKEVVPPGRWLHDKADHNADAHIKVALTGCSETIPIKLRSIILFQLRPGRVLAYFCLLL